MDPRRRRIANEGQIMKTVFQLAILYNMVRLLAKAAVKCGKATQLILVSTLVLGCGNPDKQEGGKLQDDPSELLGIWRATEVLKKHARIPVYDQEVTVSPPQELTFVRRGEDGLFMLNPLPEYYTQALTRLAPPS